MPLTSELRKEIYKVLEESVERHLSAQRKMMSKAPARSLHFTGSVGCNKIGNIVHVNIPTGSDKIEKLESIIDRVLNTHLGVSLSECNIIQNVVGMSNKVIEFTLPSRVFDS